MDPTATLTRLLQLLECNDEDDDIRYAITESLEDLINWINTGGYLPDVEKALEYKLGTDVY